MTSPSASLRGHSVRLPKLNGEARLFLNWMLVWIMLPNLPFVLTWIVGGPPRAISIITFAAAGLLMRRAPRMVQFPLFLFLYAWMLIEYVSALFNLTTQSLFIALRFAGELHVGASPEYALIAMVVLGAVAAGYVLMGREQGFSSLKFVALALLLAFAMLRADLAFTFGSVGNYQQTAPDGIPHEAGSSRLDIDGAVADGRNIVVIMVESLGVPADQRLRARLLEPWQEAAITARYDLTHGTTPFFGSTTAGEIRELCGRWGDYPELVGARDGTCLPARLAAAGYRTTAVHSFTPTFFERQDWYPNIGFQNIIFGPELTARGARTCGGVFVGACDRDVAPMLAAELTATAEPQFLYFLTLNAHLPVPADKASNTQDCQRYDARLNGEFPMICRLMSIYDDVARAMVPVFADEALPPTDILIVGDHMPPFYDRNLRAQFSSSHVPWILLRDRRAAAEK